MGKGNTGYSQWGLSHLDGTTQGALPAAQLIARANGVRQWLSDASSETLDRVWLVGVNNRNVSEYIIEFTEGATGQYHVLDNQMYVVAYVPVVRKIHLDSKGFARVERVSIEQKKISFAFKKCFDSQIRHRRQRTLSWPPIGHAPFNSAGFTGAAARSGYANLIGGAERQWQQYEWQRKHMATEKHQPGVDRLVLTDESGQPSANRTIEINGRQVVSGTRGEIRLIDQDYYGKCAAAMAERRQYVQRLVAQCLEGGAGLQVFTQLPGGFPHQAEHLVCQGVSQDKGAYDALTGTETVPKQLKAWGIPYSLAAADASIKIMFLSPYSQDYQTGVAKVIAVVTGGFAPIGALPDLPDKTRNDWGHNNPRRWTCNKMCFCFVRIKKCHLSWKAHGERQKPF